MKMQGLRQNSQNLGQQFQKTMALSSAGRNQFNEQRAPITKVMHAAIRQTTTPSIFPFLQEPFLQEHSI
jgi:hypothetical protein